MDIEQYVRSVSQQGEGQAGRLAIPLDQALEMTAQCAFPDRDWWLLKFVQAAVCSGARQIYLQLEEDQWRLRHNGASAGKIGLLDCLGREGPRRQLALCLRAGWQPPADSLELLTFYHGQVQTLSLPHSPQWRALDGSSSDQQETQLVCRWKTPQILTHKLIARLRAALRMAPAAIWLNGNLINDPGEGSRLVPGWVWLAEELHSFSIAVQPGQTSLGATSACAHWDLQAPARALASRELQWVQVAPEVKALPCWGWQSLTAEVGQHQLRVIHFGVELQSFSIAVEETAGGLTSVLSSHGLNLDLSGCRVVEDEVWQQRVQALSDNFTQLYRLFQRNSPNLSVARVLKGF